MTVVFLCALIIYATVMSNGEDEPSVNMTNIHSRRNDRSRDLAKADDSLVTSFVRVQGDSFIG